MKRCANAIVDYSSSDEEIARQDPPKSKKKKLPALSANLVVPSPVANPALHQGRVRTTPHVDGNWAAHVYVAVKISKSHALHALLGKIIGEAQDSVPTLHSLLSSERDAQCTIELHVSLSRPIFVRAHQKEGLRQVVKKLAHRPPFTMSFTTFAELQNDERTRTFLTMEVGAGHHELRDLCNGIAPFLQSLRQHSYYSSPRFHASIAWALLDGARTAGEDVPNPIPPNDPRGTVDPIECHPPAEFSTIPSFPNDLITRLNHLVATQLSSPKVGSFQVADITVRIGNEVMLWPFNGV